LHIRRDFEFQHNKKGKYTMKRNQWFKWIGVAGLGLMLSVLAAPAAQALTVNAFVVRQVCLNGDFVRVTLSATVSPAGPATALNSNPTVNHTYPDERRFTARVRAVKANGAVAFDTVTFTTRRCSGGGG
jgi:hypothetical protein